MYERLENLAAIIRDGWYGIERSKIFSPKFQTKSQWLSYIEEKFGDPPNIRNLYNWWKINDTADMNRKAFHALFIACWIFFPHEKGSFLISLDGDIFALATERMRNLIRRASSHLGGNGFSAGTGEDYYFIKGYRELLVQSEPDGLFLKGEGSRWEGGGKMEKLEHAMGFVNKVRYGEGEIANQDLRTIARGDTDHRIFVARAAENYSTKYGDLLSFMKLKGKRITIRHATEKMYKMCEERAKPSKYQGLTGIWQEKLGKAGLIPGLEISDVLNIYPIEIINEKIATILTEVIIPFAKSLPPKSDFGKKIAAAERDIRSIANYLRTDFVPGGIRIFEEIRVTQGIIEEGLARFKNILLSPTMNRT